MISSKTNPAVKEVRALRSRKSREDSGQFFIEGIRIVREAVETGADVRTCIVAPDLLSSRFGRETAETLRQRGVPYLEVSRGVFESISLKEGPQGIGAVVRQRWKKLSDIVPGGELCWVVIGTIQDPGNLGTILRTCDAVGAGGVILLGQTTDPFDPVALRGSMGAIFSQTLVRATLSDLAAWKDRFGVTLVGAADSAPLDYRTLDWRPPVALFMGSERQGLSAEQRTLCDTLARIPMVGRSDSLNLGVATAVMLYQMFNQQHPAVSLNE